MWIVQDELLDLAKEFAEIDNYVEIDRMKELQVVQKMMEKFNNNR